MPIVSVPGTDLTYSLIAYDDQGRERQDDPDGVLSGRATDALTGDPFTDVFLFSHGWMGDVPGAAQAAGGNWVGSMAGNAPDIAACMKQGRPGFRPLLIGLHWPSLPFGDDAFSSGMGAAAAVAPAGTNRVEALIAVGAARTADTPAARAALRTIFTASLTEPAPAALPQEVADAYQTLNRETGMGSGGPAAAPGADREPFDPERAFETAPRGAASFAAGGIGDALLSPLRTLSFWEMKDRARTFGEGGAHQFLGAPAPCAAAGRGVKFHFMGHSFGCIVASAAAAGPAAGALEFQVDSLVLVQGALSLWSYCSEIPSAPGQPGYFRRLIDNGRVRGPILTTRSEFDRAVGTWYPWAAGVARQVVMPSILSPSCRSTAPWGPSGSTAPASRRMTGRCSWFRRPTASNRGRSTTLKPARSSAWEAALRAPTTTSPTPKSPTPSGRRPWYKSVGIPIG